MKLLQSSKINAFGGINFVLDEFERLNLGSFLSANLPELAANSAYGWKDLFYTFASIYHCGGDCIEDAKTVLSRQFSANPIFRLCSPDTLLRRFRQLATPGQTCTTPRGRAVHELNYNDRLADLNIKLLKKSGKFNSGATVIDYDNTIVFNEKRDSRMTYKRDYGYQPGVCILNEDSVLYIENRNGNSDAKSFQADTLGRVFSRLEDNGITGIDVFRADAASYQFEVVGLLEGKVKAFYIGAVNSCVEKYFPRITDWQKGKDQKGEDILMGEIEILPFAKHYKAGQEPRAYRLLVKKKLRPDGQVNAFTQEPYDYRAVMTNDLDSNVAEALGTYHRRGAAEKQFDVLKNDFGWNRMPFSSLSENTVFLYFASLCRNLYAVVLEKLCRKFRHLRPTYRIKRFVFQFVAVPAKWVRRSRQWHLRVYGKIPPPLEI